MKKIRKADWIIMAITLVVGIGMAYLFLLTHNYEEVDNLADRYRMLADCVTIPGITFLMIGALVWVSNHGALDGLGFLFGRLFRSLIPGGRLGNEDKEGYYEYIQRKRSEKPKAYLPLIFVGAVFFIIGILFIMLFYKEFNINA